MNMPNNVLKTDFHLLLNVFQVKKPPFPCLPHCWELACRVSFHSLKQLLLAKGVMLFFDILLIIYCVYTAVFSSGTPSSHTNSQMP